MFSDGVWPIYIKQHGRISKITILLKRHFSLCTRMLCSSYQSKINTVNTKTRITRITMIWNVYKLTIMTHVLFINRSRRRYLKRCDNSCYRIKRRPRVFQGPNYPRCSPKLLVATRILTSRDPKGSLKIVIFSYICMNLPCVCNHGDLESLSLSNDDLSLVRGCSQRRNSSHK